jgi:hypothetical protein
VPNTYHIGDEVNWLTDRSGVIVEPFTFRSCGDRLSNWNCGDPQYRNLILFDLDIVWGDSEGLCLHCKTELAAMVAIVRQGVFHEVRALLKDDYDAILGGVRGKVDIVIIREDGSYWPREDWYDHPLKYVPESCDPLGNGPWYGGP